MYAAVIFAVGFAFGAIRVLWVAPRLGALGAVLIELPFMLAASWLVCARVLRAFRVSAAAAARFATGLAAFVLLIAAELALAVFAFGTSVADFFAAYDKVEGAVGLVGQLAFAALPMMLRRAT